MIHSHIMQWSENWVLQIQRQNFCTSKSKIMVFLYHQYTWIFRCGLSDLGPGLVFFKAPWKTGTRGHEDCRLGRLSYKDEPMYIYMSQSGNMSPTKKGWLRTQCWTRHKSKWDRLGCVTIIWISNTRPPLPPDPTCPGFVGASSTNHQMVIYRRNPLDKKSWPPDFPSNSEGQTLVDCK